MTRQRPLALALAALAGLGAFPVTLPAQLAEGRTFFFRIESSDDGPAEGRMHVVGDRARIEISDAEDDRDRSVYLLLTNGGRTLVTVRPEERTYSEIEASTFEGVIGTAMRAADVVLTLNLVSSNITGERLGAGDQIAGLPTRRYRLTQDFAFDVGALGQTERIRQRIVSEYWVNDTAGVPRNPIVELVTAAPGALAQSNEAFVERTRRERAALFSAAPLKIVVRSTKWESEGAEEEEEEYEYEITRILPASIDPRALRVPESYRKESGDGVHIDW